MPQLQHDASDFLLHLLRSGSGGAVLSKWLAVSPHGRHDEIEESGSGIVHMALPPGEDVTCLDNVVQAWRHQDS